MKRTPPPDEPAHEGRARQVAADQSAVEEGEEDPVQVHRREPQPVGRPPLERLPEEEAGKAPGIVQPGGAEPIRRQGERHVDVGGEKTGRRGEQEKIRFHLPSSVKKGGRPRARPPSARAEKPRCMRYTRRRSSPMRISPPKCWAISSRITSPGAAGGTMWERTTVPTPAAAATRPTSSVVA